MSNISQKQQCKSELYIFQIYTLYYIQLVLIFLDTHYANGSVHSPTVHQSLACFLCKYCTIETFEKLLHRAQSLNVQDWQEAFHSSF